MEKGRLLLRQEEKINILENGKMVWQQEKELIFMKVGISMLVNLKVC